MARTRKITVTMPHEVAAELASVATPNVSAWVTDAVRDRIRREKDLAAWHEAIGGTPPQDALNWARQTLGVPAQQAL